MNYSKFLSIFLLIFIVNSVSHNALSQDLSKINSLILLNVGDEKITYEQLEKAYQKNITKQQPHLYMLPEDSLMDFLNLYANFRLKVLEAKRLGLDKDSSIIAESLQNRRILSESYLFDKKVSEYEINKMLDRRKYEYRIGIIFTTFNQAPVRDTALAFEKINKAMKEIQEGADFEDAARKYNDDENLGKNGGKVDQWITSGKIYREIEEAIYSTEPGKVYPNLIITPFGYFIVKVYDKQPRKFVLGAHILFKLEGPEDSLNLVEEKAKQALQAIKNGASFEEIAKKESQDNVTAENGGLFSEYFSRSTGFEKSKGMLDITFADALFNLKDGEVSDVIKTNFGYHIIKRIATRDLYEAEEKDELKKIYRKQYFESDKAKFLDNELKKLNFSINQKLMDQILSILDTNASNINKSWSDSIPENLMEETLFSMDKKNYTLKTFIDLMNTQSNLRGFAINEDGIVRAIKKILEPDVIAFATKNLENEFPDFKQTLNEFNDGVLLFKAETMEVWNKVKFDTLRAQKYYEKNKTKYITDPTYDITEIYVLSDSLAQEIYKSVLKGENFDTLASKFTQRSGYREKSGYMGKVSGISNKFGKILKEKQITGPIVLSPQPIENGYTIIKVNAYEAPRQKTFEEAIPDFASKMQEEYQKELSSKWIEKLRKTFNVKVDKKNLKKVMENKNN